ncbi:MAG: GNAT family N-acetyltransferase [Chloroflexi bacterium]|nr:GNAT family N-acetyltransferase [Chloroflexota bacterium]|tara:strand:- start:33155 stop:33622 length:468 start_codon:yes stop_codon:yes gene_type:complete
MELREITEKDIETQVEFLFKALWQSDDEERYDINVMQDVYAAKYYENWNTGKEDIGYFLVENNQIIGMVQSRIKRSSTLRYAELPEVVIAISDNHHGKGYGKKLMKFIISKTKMRGVRLGVHPKNVIAQKLYKKLGFECYQITDDGFQQLVFLKK